jgi:hypothetical protein
MVTFHLNRWSGCSRTGTAARALPEASGELRSEHQPCVETVGTYALQIARNNHPAAAVRLP